MISEVSGAGAARTLGDVGGHRNRGTTRLQRESEPLFSWPPAGQAVGLRDQHHGLLPRNQVAVATRYRLPLLSHNPASASNEIHTSTLGPPYRLTDSPTFRLRLYVHHAWAAGSRMTTSLRKATALVKPSLTLISESSCSMEITPS